MLEEESIEVITQIDEENKAYFELIQWWEKRRKQYNFILIGFAILLLGYSFFFEEGYSYYISKGEYLLQMFLGILMAMIFLNILYFFGWILDAFFKYKNSGFSTGVRLVFYWMGVVFSVLFILSL